MKKCLNCEKELKGRSDKKFCDNDCRNEYNNTKNRDVNKTMRNINNRLRKNRRILSDLIPKDEEMGKVHQDKLHQKGFDFNYFTHLYTTKKGKVYHFVYDLGYLNLGENWFLIVKREV
ncbi:MAG: hypothetical protein CSA38_02935 [Flavobacteriales bacterium]|nr:MAG: hypothetical protein CSA38_02935 [Flavobacteriales bacterium]